MTYLLCAILCSVAVSVFLKRARTQNIVIEQAILVNYVVATALTWFFLSPNLNAIAHEPNAIMLFVALGVLLPTVFIMMSHAVQHAGIVKSDAAQRLALFIPILASFLIFGEQLKTSRMVGIGLAFLALLCLIAKPSAAGKNRASSGNQGALIGSLLAVWVGYGVIDVLFKQVAKTGSATPANLFAAFVLAGVLMLIYLLIKRTRWNDGSLASGIILGALNFGNIWFYIRAHQEFSDNPTLVFAGMNVGVIALGTLVGAGLFREKLSRINVLGIAIAMSAIVCLFYLERFFPAV
ncbi:EamA/RhaT family transporter [Hydromonas duriensis]|uniref:EamA-like transporter family protein n=1 Tax=Hydromonas duriensis TaxID=1527608 RepID=A0A4R6Y7G4_9BURK|nr:EamA/RhaT family transporter [Hydromonas duriensis]TDR31272.1 hypothetical protein DFR44_11135 [Hydromonas duriensis]